MPSLAEPCRAEPSLAEPCRALPCRAMRCKAQSSRAFFTRSCEHCATVLHNELIGTVAQCDECGLAWLTFLSWRCWLQVRAIAADRRGRAAVAGPAAPHTRARLHQRHHVSTLEYLALHQQSRPVVALLCYRPPATVSALLHRTAVRACIGLGQQRCSERLDYATVQSVTADGHRRPSVASRLLAANSVCPMCLMATIRRLVSKCV